MITNLERALQSRGGSNEAIYRMVARELAACGVNGKMLLDVGCGAGSFWPHVKDRFEHYTGVDIERYGGFPDGECFVRSDLESYAVPLPEGAADAVVAVETIEHVENPRAFVRELRRLVKPGGWVAVTTPNQLSLLSRGTVLCCGEFNAFRASSYPAHITALLEIDLRRIAMEAGLCSARIGFSGRGRIPGGSLHWPRWFSAVSPRWFSDNICLLAARPKGTTSHLERP